MECDSCKKSAQPAHANLFPPNLTQKTCPRFPSFSQQQQQPNPSHDTLSCPITSKLINQTCWYVIKHHVLHYYTMSWLLEGLKKSRKQYRGSLISHLKNHFIFPSTKPQNNTNNNKAPNQPPSNIPKHNNK